jgi:SPP1 family predicted phage head-tail adaptor
MPYRPKSDAITQTYNNGTVRIYAVTNTAEPGRKPQIGETLIETLPYEEQSIGVTRYYQARQNQVDIEKVVRVPFRQALNNKMAAKLEDGEAYRIDFVQPRLDVFPVSMDLTLKQYDQSGVTNV